MTQLQHGSGAREKRQSRRVPVSGRFRWTAGRVESAQSAFAVFQPANGVVQCHYNAVTTRMRFEWDEVKNRRNLRKHKISFQTASLVFDDPYARSMQDRVLEAEERWQTLGMIRGAIVLVAHTYREEGGELVIRIVSARKATLAERKAYEGHETSG